MNPLILVTLLIATAAASEQYPGYDGAAYGTPHINVRVTAPAPTQSYSSPPQAQSYSPPAQSQSYSPPPPPSGQFTPGYYVESAPVYGTTAPQGYFQSGPAPNAGPVQGYQPMTMYELSKATTQSRTFGLGRQY